MSRANHGTPGALNGAFAALAVGAALAAAVPVGSHRPVLWALWGMALAGGLALYLLMRAGRAPDRPLRSPRLRAPLIAGAGFGAAAALQVLPLGLAPARPAAFAGLATLSIDPGQSLAALTRLAAYGALAVLVIEVAGRRQRIRRMQLALFAGVVAQAAYALIALRFLGDTGPWEAKTAYAGFATGTFVGRNALAMFLGMGALTGLALAMAPRDATAPRRARVGLLAGVVVIAAALMATGSRMGLAATVAGALVLFALMRHGAPRRRIASDLALAALAGLVLLAAFGGATLERGLIGLTGPDSRLILWRQVLPMIWDRPLTGFGLDSFATAFRAYHGAGLEAGLVWDHAHSTYLGLWVEMGLIAGSLPLICVALAGRTAWRNARRGSMRGSLAIAVIVQCALHASIDFALEIPANAFLFIILIGLGISPTRQRGPS